MSENEGKFTFFLGKFWKPYIFKLINSRDFELVSFCFQILMIEIRMLIDKTQSKNQLTRNKLHKISYNIIFFCNNLPPWIMWNIPVLTLSNKIEKYLRHYLACLLSVCQLQCFRVPNLVNILQLWRTWYTIYPKNDGFISKIILNY